MTVQNFPFRSPIFLYGPPGSGKTTVGRALAEALALSFSDLDERIAAQAGLSIPEIFEAEGEAGFRRRENAVLEQVLDGEPGVVSLGGGTLLAETCRSRVEAAGPLVCLRAAPELLAARLQGMNGRPLLAGDLEARLETLLARRSAHYTSFPLQVDTSDRAPEEVAWEIQAALGWFKVRGMGTSYDVRIRAGGLDELGEALRQEGFSGHVALVADENVSRLYAGRSMEVLRGAGFSPVTIEIPAGEAYKNIRTLEQIWEALLNGALDRSSPVVALGGGVTGDLAGFAAATFLRGVPWIAVPTSLLAMADASLGGKTGADLPQGKNLIGAFHPPRLVLADPEALATLPEAELRSGMAEVVKAGLIGDPSLFERCEAGWKAVWSDWGEVIRRTMAVKVQIVQEDPYERGRRAVLNLGHTFGHALEHLSGYRLRHGEAVAIGLALAARLSERLGLAESGLVKRIETTLGGLGLPVDIPGGIDPAALEAALRVDKKRAAGAVRFVLPVKVGEVKAGVVVENWKTLLSQSLDA